MGLVYPATRVTNSAEREIFQIEQTLAPRKLPPWYAQNVRARSSVIVDSFRLFSPCLLEGKTPAAAVSQLGFSSVWLNSRHCLSRLTMQDDYGWETCSPTPANDAASAVPTSVRGSVYALSCNTLLVVGLQARTGRLGRRASSPQFWVLRRQRVRATTI
jgi:hypothetical protein